MSSPYSSGREDTHAASSTGGNIYTLAPWDRSTSDSISKNRPKNPRPAKKMRTFTDFSLDSSKALPATNSPEYQHNIDRSPIHQLPAELMLDIIEYVSKDTTSILCMQLVARSLYPLFESPLFILPEERDAFKAALRRDDLTWFAKLEQLKGLDALPKALCSACGICHHKTQFAPEELAKGPQQRRCVRAEEVILLNGERKATLNELFDLTPDKCLQLGIAAVYVSKSVAKVTPKQVKKPVLETIVAHVTSNRNLEVTFHFHHSMPSDAIHTHNGSTLQSMFTDDNLVCPKLQASLLRCEAVTDDRKALKGLKRKFGIYPDEWYVCICGSSTCNKALWSNYIHVDEAQGTKEMVLSLRRTFPAEENYMGPDWHKVIIDRLTEQQIELNANSGDTSGICLYEAKEKGEWSRTTLLGSGRAS